MLFLLYGLFVIVVDNYINVFFNEVVCKGNKSIFLIVNLIFIMECLLISDGEIIYYYCFMMLI